LANILTLRDAILSQETGYFICCKNNSKEIEDDQFIYSIREKSIKRKELQAPVSLSDSLRSQRLHDPQSQQPISTQPKHQLFVIEGLGSSFKLLTESDLQLILKKARAANPGNVTVMEEAIPSCDQATFLNMVNFSQESKKVDGRQFCQFPILDDEVKGKVVAAWKSTFISGDSKPSLEEGSKSEEPASFSFFPYTKADVLKYYYTQHVEKGTEPVTIKTCPNLFADPNLQVIRFLLSHKSPKPSSARLASQPRLFDAIRNTKIELKPYFDGKEIPVPPISRIPEDPKRARKFSYKDASSGQGRKGSMYPGMNRSMFLQGTIDLQENAFEDFRHACPYSVESSAETLIGRTLFSEPTLIPKMNKTSSVRSSFVANQRVSPTKRIMQFNPKSVAERSTTGK
jgi:hypothetical protein